MVHILKEWSGFEEYAANCRNGFFRISDMVNGQEIRILAGRCGFKKFYKNGQDEELKKVIAFCKQEDFKEVEESVNEELFFI